MMWHKWYPSRWLSSETRLRMTPTERAIYRDLLDVCYQEGSIPSDERTLAGLAAVSITELRRAWPEVSKKFIPTDDGRLTNPVCVEEMRHREESMERRTKAGRIAGISSAAVRRQSSTNRQRIVDESLTNRVPEINDSSTEEEVDIEEEKSPPTPPLQTNAWKPDWERCVREYPETGLINPMSDLRLFLSIVETTEEEVRFFEGLARWKLCQRWQEGYVVDLEKFLSKRMYLSKPPAAAKRSNSVQELYQ